MTPRHLPSQLTRRGILSLLTGGLALALSSRLAPRAAANQQGSTVNDINAYLRFCRQSGGSIDVPDRDDDVTIVKCRWGGVVTIACAWQDGVPGSKVCLFTELSAAHRELAALDLNAVPVTALGDLLPSELTSPADEAPMAPTKPAPTPRTQVKRKRRHTRRR